MECSSSSFRFFSTLSKPPSISHSTTTSRLWTTSPYRRSNRIRWKMRASTEVSGFSYQKFIDFALDESRRRTQLTTSVVQDNFSSLVPMDGKTELQVLSLQAPKIRLLRSLYIQGSEPMQFLVRWNPWSHLSKLAPFFTVIMYQINVMQVLDFAVFPRPEFDLPIFCANIFATASLTIVVLDLNPLHDVISQRDYKEKYYKSLMPLGLKYAELLPWGGKITSESLRFFSPIVIWTKFLPSQQLNDVLYSAFMDYYKAWLDLMDQAAEETNTLEITRNCEAQHRYLTWRAEKDPGHRVLKKLIGEANAKDLMKNFLFNGIDELGSKTFLDYFPEYHCDDGTINEKRSIIGKSFEHRPWDSSGEFISNAFR